MVPPRANPDIIFLKTFSSKMTFMFPEIFNTFLSPKVKGGSTFSTNQSERKPEMQKWEENLAI